MPLELGKFAWHTLSGILPEHVGGVEFVISPDSQTVFYIAGNV